VICLQKKTFDHTFLFVPDGGCVKLPLHIRYVLKML
jgi:hypothetical protein